MTSGGANRFSGAHVAPSTDSLPSSSNNSIPRNLLKQTHYFWWLVIDKWYFVILWMQVQWRGCHEVVGTYKPYHMQKICLSFLNLQALRMQKFWVQALVARSGHSHPSHLVKIPLPIFFCKWVMLHLQFCKILSWYCVWCKRLKGFALRTMHVKGTLKHAETLTSKYPF